MMRSVRSCLLQSGLALYAATANALDKEGDGMSDVWQRIYNIASGDAHSDPDGDGYTIAQEALAGTHPFDSTSRLMVNSFSVTATTATLTWKSEIGKKYDIEVSSDLWTWTHNAYVDGDGSNFTATITVAAAQRGFFRIRVLAAADDSDGDTLSDWEESLLGTNKNSVDTDGDGLPDGWEFIHHLDANNPSDASADPDGDGWTNLQEWLTGGDPLDANIGPSFPAAQIVGDGTQNERKSKQATFTLPAGNQSYIVVVAVKTDEYPDWTFQSSQYDDVADWNISTANGPLMQGSVRVNSLHAALTQSELGGTSCLGLAPYAIVATGTVQANPASPTQVQLEVGATNVSDGEFPTTVVAALTPIEVAVDANRDGTIASGETASQDKPLRFWINNDSDTGDNDKEEEGNTPDYQWGRISNSRGLEDFELLKLGIPQEIFDKVRQNQAQLGLKWKNTSDGIPGVKIYRVSDDINASKDYLWNVRKANTQTNSPYYLSIGTVASTSTTWLPADTLVRYASTEQHPYLLFEGSAKGTGQLCLVIKMNGVEIDGPGVWLKLMDVEEMFESAQGTPGMPYPNPPDYIAQQPPRPATSYERIYWPGRGQFEQDSDETNEAIIMVHGWRMTDSDRRTFSETFFKRLWWKGFKGRFCTFAWPTYNSDNNALGFIPNHYNKSEYVAWKYGPALKAYVDSISKSSKNVAAHSMGNVVMASALKSGLTVNSYVAMEAAIPAGCYDASNAANGYLKFLQAEQSKPTPDQANPDLGYRGVMAGVSGNFHNFYSDQDFALKTGATAIVGRTNWEANQVDYKPDGPNGYNHVVWTNPPITESYINVPGGSAVDRRYITDHHEMMSFIARPHSEALGVRSTAGFNPFNLAGVSLKYPFGGDRTEHSGQFQRPIQKTHKFFNTLLQRMNVGFNSLTDVQVGDASP